MLCVPASGFLVSGLKATVTEVHRLLLMLLFLSFTILPTPHFHSIFHSHHLDLPLTVLIYLPRSLTFPLTSLAAVLPPPALPALHLIDIWLHRLICGTSVQANRWQLPRWATTKVSKFCKVLQKLLCQYFKIAESNATLSSAAVTQNMKLRYYVNSNSRRSKNEWFTYILK